MELVNPLIRNRTASREGLGGPDGPPVDLGQVFLKLELCIILNLFSGFLSGPEMLFSPAPFPYENASSIVSTVGVS